MTSKKATVFVLGTCDTKLDELLYLRSRVPLHGPHAQVLLLDADAPPCHRPHASRSRVPLIRRRRDGSTAAQARRSRLPLCLHAPAAPWAAPAARHPGTSVPWAIVYGADIVMLYPIVDAALV
ncbi:hypothetical protein GGR54DRAFT_642129 [Hypoxylon sp. NC1633]|nr:hypothetical protein GGR54DRAFT_642129 [Hypoxylon sp. NC1633]